MYQVCDTYFIIYSEKTVFKKWNNKKRKKVLQLAFFKDNVRIKKVFLIWLLPELLGAL